ncbi:Lrp/AsnC family transcriptional regulator [Nocardia sp. NBC_01503]|uniref:Lrp/AsnC family transcriptional regulator n=1 Tax=Nocardia sp. NBC_01503 TaxID=2975997 RepID=UPI002E7C4D81|nr:Lrp/AsnC family transcriptional regulator [Nocardia sp. NBC_01503]WTL29815.1 Lrp/AsnC family transcriptional regulator [Nocardia sp. NBC_01503]
MALELPGESAILDDLDKRIVHGLVVDARIPFAKLAAILDVSEQTVARRYRAMRQRGILHISGQINVVPLGHARWILRIRSTPSGAFRLAEALARLPELSWVALLSTGSEVMCVSRARTAERRDALLLKLIPGTPQVTELIAHEVMHNFPLDEDWPRYSRMLTAEQLRALGPGRPVRDAAVLDAPVALTPEDEAMLTILARDGRAPYSQLAAATGWSAPRVARRMAELLESGVLYFDLDFALERMGVTVRAAIWLRVRPADLAAVGAALATYPEVTYVAATTGPTTMTAALVCHDTAHLYRFVTERLGALDGITDVEVTPALRLFKQAQVLMDAGRITLVR